MPITRPNVGVGKRLNEINEIYIGIDFGTSFTKVSYTYSSRAIVPIKTKTWDNNLFRESVLYLKDNRLYFDKPEDPFTEIKYFKYSIFENRLRNSDYEQNTRNNLEIMCCIYFLAQVIKRTTDTIKEEYHLPSLNDKNIFINMGIPLEDMDTEEHKTKKEIYLNILEAAILLAGGSKVEAILPQNSVAIESLDKVYTEILDKKPYLNWKYNVYPELAAEVSLYNSSRNVPIGTYIVIDVGGGTVDIAFFQKSYNLNHNVDFELLHQKVLPIGAEVIKTNENDNNLETEFRTNFNAIFVEARGFLNIDLMNTHSIKVFLLGGGMMEPTIRNWYLSNINRAREIMQNIQIPEFILEEDVVQYFDEDNPFETKNQRLIISQMLSRHPENIPRLVGTVAFNRALRQQEQRLNERNNRNLYDDIQDRADALIM